MSTANSFDNIQNEINKIVANFNKEVVSVANKCKDRILLRANSIHSPEYKGNKNNPIDLFIKRMPENIDGKFTYGGN